MFGFGMGHRTQGMSSAVTVTCSSLHHTFKTTTIKASSWNTQTALFYYFYGGRIIVFFPPGQNIAAPPLLISYSYTYTM